MADDAWSAFPVANEAKSDDWSAFPAVKTEEPTEEAPGQLEAGLRGLGQGIALNFEPNIAGAGAALLSGDTFGEAGKKAYEERRLAEVARNKAAEEANPWTYGVGQVGGAIASPANLIVPGVGPEMGAAEAALRVAAPSALIGGASGYGAGETPEEKTKGALLGTLTGTVGGGALGALAGRAAPAAEKAAETTISAGQKLAEAGQNLNVPLPRAATSDMPGAGIISEKLQKIPIVGTPLEKAAADTQTGLQKAVDNLGGVDPEQAGMSAIAGLQDHLGPTTKKALADAYDAVNSKIDTSIKSPLTETNKVAQQILAERAEQNAPGSSGAVNFVKNAIADSLENGMTYNGIKGLRTRIGESLSSPNNLPVDVSQSEFNRIYGAMSKDLGAAAQNAGGVEGKAAFDSANSLASSMKQSNEKLATILGSQYRDLSAEGVFGGLAKFASSSPSSANINLLRSAKQVVSPDQWSDISKGVIATLGRNPDGSFNPTKFVGPQGYNKLSDAGKTELFGPAGSDLRQALDDLSTLSSSKYVQSAAHPGKMGAGEGIVGATVAHLVGAKLLTVLPAAIGGRGMAEFLSRPQTAKALADVTKNSGAYYASPTAVTKDILQKSIQQLTRVHAAATGQVIAPDFIMNAIDSAAKSNPRQQRASGGKVMTADDMIVAAERAKNRNNKTTEPLLQVPDEAITKALSVANQHI